MVENTNEQPKRNQAFIDHTALINIYQHIPVDTEGSIRDLVGNASAKRANSEYKHLILEKFTRQLNKSLATPTFQIYILSIFNALFDSGRSEDSAQDFLQSKFEYLIGMNAPESSGLYLSDNVKELEKNGYIYLLEEYTKCRIELFKSGSPVVKKPNYFHNWKIQHISRQIESTSNLLRNWSTEFASKYNEPILEI